MHCIDDKANGIVLNHNSDWSGDVCIGWYVVDARAQASNPLLPVLRECWCRGSALVAGSFEYTRGVDPPLGVITRSVALAVEACLRAEMLSAVQDYIALDRRRS